MFRETFERLHATLVGAISLDDVVPGCAIFEKLAQCDPRPAVCFLERRRDLECDGLTIAAVLPDEALGTHNFPIGHAIRIIAAVRTMHRQPPFTAWPHVHSVS